MNLVARKKKKKTCFLELETLFFCICPYLVILYHNRTVAAFKQIFCILPIVQQSLQYFKRKFQQKCLPLLLNPHDCLLINSSYVDKFSLQVLLFFSLPAQHSLVSFVTVFFKYKNSFTSLTTVVIREHILSLHVHAAISFIFHTFICNSYCFDLSEVIIVATLNFCLNLKCLAYATCSAHRIGFSQNTSCE